LSSHGGWISRVFRTYYANLKLKKKEKKRKKNGITLMVVCGWGRRGSPAELIQVVLRGATHAQVKW